MNSQSLLLLFTNTKTHLIVPFIFYFPGVQFLYSSEHIYVIHTSVQVKTFSPKRKMPERKRKQTISYFQVNRTQFSNLKHKRFC